MKIHKKTILLSQLSHSMKKVEESLGGVRNNLYLCKWNPNDSLHNMNEILKHAHPYITTLCRKHGVKNLYVFGSVLTTSFSDKSDVDFLVEFDTDKIPDYFTNFFDLKYALEDTMGRDVDLVEEKAIRNPIFKRNIERTKMKIYG